MSLTQLSRLQRKTRDVAGGRRYGSYSPATTLEMWQVGDGTDLTVLLLHKTKDVELNKARRSGAGRSLFLLQV